MIQVTEVNLPLQSHMFVGDVLVSGQLAQGDYVESLEQFVSTSTNTNYAVAVNSGTAALHLALSAVADPGDTVAIPAFTFAGTANAVIASGCTPVIVDVGDDRLIDPDLVPDDVDVIMPVHLFGAKAVTDFGWDRPVVEDAAQAIGHHLSFGAISLYGSKTVGAGEGGIVVTNDAEVADFVRLYRNQGMRSRYEHVGPGFNFRLTDLQAAVALGQMTKLRTTLARRRYVADYYWGEFHDLAVGLPDPFGQTWHQFVVEVPNRDAIAEFMASNGVETRVHYPVPLNQMDWLEAEGDFPNADRLARQVLSLPVHEHLSDVDVERVAQVFKGAVDKYALV